jgi:hypothetical protein
MDLLNKETLLPAALAAMAALLVMKFTAGKSKLIQGAALVAAIAVTKPLAAKII